MALKNIKVIELGGLAPVPYCGMILADFGATVIRVDKVGDSLNLECLVNGKKSVVLNLKHPEGQNILKKLCKTSDVLIEPFREGVMETLNLGPENLLKDNPRLIYARLNAYGRGGPLSNKAGHELNCIALSGLLSQFGRKTENPSAPLTLISDTGGGGLMCALGILLALLERNNSGLGQVVDNSMVNGTAYLGSWLYRSQKLPVWGKERGENLLDTGTHFYEIYKTKDEKFMSVGAIEPQFYAELLQGLELSQDEAPQLGDFTKLKNKFTEIFLQKTQAEWCQIFDKTDACVAPVLDLDAAPNHPHNLTQKTFTEIDDIYVPNPCPVLSRTPGISKGIEQVPKYGEHTSEVLSEIGYSQDMIEKFQKEGVIENFLSSNL